MPAADKAGEPLTWRSLRELIERLELDDDAMVHVAIGAHIVPAFGIKTPTFNGHSVTIQGESRVEEYDDPPLVQTPYEEFFNFVIEVRKAIAVLIRREAEITDYTERGTVAREAAELSKSVRVLSDLLWMLDLGEHR